MTQTPQFQPEDTTTTAQTPTASPATAEIPIVMGPGRGLLLVVPLDDEGLPPADVNVEIHGCKIPHQIQHGIHGWECVNASLEGQERVIGRRLTG